MNCSSSWSRPGTIPRILNKALAAGANDYLTKPLDLGLLNVRLSVAERQIRDLAERNQARAALQESASTMANILENTTDGFFALDHDWKFTYANPQAEMLLGRTRDRADRQRVCGHEFPELKNSAFEQNYRRVLEDRVAMDFQATDADGKIWFEMRAYPNNSGRFGVLS